MAVAQVALHEMPSETALENLLRVIAQGQPIGAGCLHWTASPNGVREERDRCCGAVDSRSSARLMTE
jgi:hypothetical protein